MLDRLHGLQFSTYGNGKAERFIQSALREWAYGFTYQNSAERTAAVDN